MTRHREHVQSLASQTGGRIVDWAGDGCFLTFPTPSAAVRFALGVQFAHDKEQELPRVRIGIHIGEVSEQANPSGVGRPDVDGLAVGLASRIADLAEAGQILLSASAYEASRSRLEAQLEGWPVRWDTHGSYRLKGFEKPLEICEVGLEGQAPFRRPAASAKAAPATGETPDVSWRSGARQRSVLVAIVAAAAVAVGAYVASQNSRMSASTSAASAPITSLAVLPFDNYSGDPDQDYFVEGMTEALISELAQIDSLRVISRTSVMPYRDTDKPAPQVARELGVEGLVEGSVYKGGDEIRITAQLIRGDTDEHLWAASYTESLENVLQLQARIALAISREIRASLTPAEAKRLATTRKTVPEAHTALLKG